MTETTEAGFTAADMATQHQAGYEAGKAQGFSAADMATQYAAGFKAGAGAVQLSYLRMKPIPRKEQQDD